MLRATTLLAIDEKKNIGFGLIKFRYKMSFHQVGEGVEVFEVQLDTKEFNVHRPDFIWARIGGCG